MKATNNRGMRIVLITIPSIFPVPFQILAQIISSEIDLAPTDKNTKLPKPRISKANSICPVNFPKKEVFASDV